MKTRPDHELHKEGEARSTNIVGETKKFIMDEPVEKKKKNSEDASDEEVRKAVERINPDPNSMKNWG